MRRARCALLIVAALLCTTSAGMGDDAGTGGRRALVVARLGTTSITVGELEDRIAALPPFQRASFGETPAAVRRTFLDAVVLHDALLVAGAEHAALGAKPPAAYEIERAFSAATVRSVRTQVGPAAAISMQDVAQYYDENRARYDTPARYQLWRILCKTREDAQAVLDAARKDATPVAFANLARERSIDRATNLRSGNLGFVTAEGTSNEPGLRVDPAVVHAAQAVADGAFVLQPVPEGEYFAVVWRRGTVAATKRSVAEATAQIRDTIWKGRVKKDTDALVASLRHEHLRDLNAAVLSAVELPPADDPASALRPRAPGARDAAIQ